MTVLTLLPSTIDKPGPSTQAQLAFGGIVRSELLKLRAVRSSWLLPIFAILTMWLSGACFAYIAASTPAGELSQDNFASIPGSGSFVAGILMAASAIAMVVAEYRTNSLNMSLLVVPSRSALFAAKAVVATVVGLSSGVIGALGALLAGYVVLGTHNVSLDLSNATLWINAAGAAAIFLSMVWISFSVAFVLHSAMGSLFVVLAALIAPSTIDLVAVKLDWTWLSRACDLLPGALLNTATATIHSSDLVNRSLISPLAAVVLLPCWGATLLLISAYTFRRRRTPQ